jgi:hypothetical protein
VAPKTSSRGGACASRPLSARQGLTLLPKEVDQIARSFRTHPEGVGRVKSAQPARHTRGGGYRQGKEFSNGVKRLLQKNWR